MASNDRNVPSGDEEPESQGGSLSRWRTWLPWLRWLVKPVRLGVLLFIVLLVIEYLVVPELVGASKDLYLLGRINATWVIAGTALEGASLFCYAVLTRALLPPGRKPSLSRLFRIDLSAAAVAHVIPAGTLGSPLVPYTLLTLAGSAIWDQAKGNALQLAALVLGFLLALRMLGRRDD